MKEKKQILGITYLMITALIWGGSFISQKEGGLALGVFGFNAARCVLSCFVCALIVIVNNFRKEKRITFFPKNCNKTKLYINSLCCAITLFFGMIIQQIGVNFTDTGKAGLIAALEVICVPIIMFIAFKRRIRFITWIFIITAMLGIMLLSINSISGINKGDIITLISTIVFSITIIQLPKRLDNLDPFLFSFFRLFYVMILSILGTIIFESNKLNLTAIYNARYAMLYSGVLASGVAYIFQILGQKNCEPVISTLIMSLEGVFAAILGWLVLGESLNIIQIFGAGLSFVSIVGVQLTDNPF